MKNCAQILSLICSVLLLSCAPLRASTDTVRTAIPAKEIQLRSTMKSLFNECLKKQRNLAVQTLTGSEKAAEARAGLMETLGKIGIVFNTYYGDQAGGEISTLLKTYMVSTADYAAAVKNGGDKALAVSAMHDKADKLVNLFSTYKRFWARTGLAAALKKYSDLGVDEIEMLSRTQAAPDAKVFAATFEQSAKISEILAMGIARQFPEQFQR